MIELILLGGGGHCESVIEVIQGLPEYKIMGILDPSFEKNNAKELMGIQILGSDDDINVFTRKGYQFVITVGQIKSSSIREKLSKTVLSAGGKLPVIIAASAHVSPTAVIGEGTVVMHNSFVNANASIGSCCIINTGSIIEHSCTIGNFCHISTGAILNGEAKCGSRSFIGSGTVVNHGIKIGDDCIVGSGSLVRKDLAHRSLVCGNPLKELK